MASAQPPRKIATVESRTNAERFKALPRSLSRQYCPAERRPVSGLRQMGF
jgi:hypothetical protein